jgi:succinoglycan biosynthesis transport protein ExoP
LITPQKPQAPGFEFHWQSIVRILWKGKVGVLAIWVALSLVTAAVVLQLPAIYKAECLLLVVGQKIPEKYVASTVNTDPQERLAAISHQILSNGRLQNVIDTFGLYKQERAVMSQDQIIKQMRENDITLKLESGLSNTRPDAFRVSFQAKDPKVAADVANGLAKLIIAENRNTREGHAEDTSQFMEEQQKEAKATLDKLEARVSEYKTSHGGELPQQEQSLAGTLSRLQVELQGNQEALNRAEQNKALLQNTLNIAEASLTTLERTSKETRDREETNRRLRISGGDPQSTAPARPKTRRQTLQEELASLRSRYGEEHPEIRRVKAELADLPPDPNDPEAPKIARQGPEPLPAGPSEAIVSERERVLNLRMQIGMAAKEFEAANASRLRVLRDIDVYQGRINRLPLREQEMAGLTRDYEIAKENYKALLNNRLSADMATELERSQQGERFTLIEPARIPEEPFKPPRNLLIIGGVILSLLLSGLIVVGRRLPKDTMLGEWELTPGIVVLGRVPMIETDPRKLAAATPGGSTA